MAPGHPLVAARRARGERAARGGVPRPYEQADHVLAPAVDEAGDGTATDHVQPAAQQREAIGREVRDRRGEVELAVEPRLHRVLVGGGDVGEMRRMERTQVRVEDL